MKTTTLLAIALGVGALAACNNSATEQTADNIEANAENTADTIEANAENASDTLQANAENAADEVREAGENQADAVRNSADADGNSSNYSSFPAAIGTQVASRRALRRRSALFFWLRS